MKTRKLGRNGPLVSEIGFGCMGLSYGYGPGVARQQGVAQIRAAFDNGVTFFDTAEAYGALNEEMLGEAVELRLREMRNELAHTDDRAYRAALRERLERLETIGQALGVKTPEVPHLGGMARS